MISWATKRGKELNMVLTIQKSRSTNFFLCCKLSGTYRPAKKGNSQPAAANIGVHDELTVKLRSRKIDCPFMLRGSRNRYSRKWHIAVECGSHNHDLSTSCEGYAFAGRLTKEQKMEVRSQTLADVEPKKILTTLQEKYPGITTSLKQVYDYRYQVIKTEMNGQGVSQYAIKFLDSRGYYVQYRTAEGTNNILDIFFAHPQSIQLLKLFPYVVVMDSTYKTNM